MNNENSPRVDSLSEGFTTEFEVLASRLKELEVKRRKLEDEGMNGIPKEEDVSEAASISLEMLDIKEELKKLQN
ncbi:MAG: hypothetical protein CEO12_57 [Parcubacteria group bacterium Gr01-1014_46]|nr:MAG: hypothetical protein CEO12_57 [Parcubacteria group bacterium Gr01-1014_46]